MVDFHIEGETILILGNRSYKNMGDELILLGTIRLLQKQKKKVVVSAYDPIRLKTFFSQFEDLEPITYIHEFPKGIRSGLKYFFSKRIKELQIYRGCDAVIIGGGEILTEESKNSYRYRNLGLLPFVGKLKEIGIYLMGGIQIPQKKRNKRLFNWLLKKTKKVFARDSDSIEALESIGYMNAEFFMDTSWYIINRDEIPKEENNEEVFVNLNKNGEKFFDKLLLECKEQLEQGKVLKYVPVSKGKGDIYNDLIYKEKLEKCLGVDIEIEDWEKDFKGFVRKIKNASLVITARLHLFLIASYLGVKTKVFPYQKKILKMKKIIEKVGIL